MASRTFSSLFPLQRGLPLGRGSSREVVTLRRSTAHFLSNYTGPKIPAAWVVGGKQAGKKTLPRVSPSPRTGLNVLKAAAVSLSCGWNVYIVYFVRYYDVNLWYWQSFAVFWQWCRTTVAAAALGLRSSDGSRSDGSVSLQTQPPLDESPDATAESFCVAFRAVCFGELPHPAFYRAVSRHTILLLFFLVPSSYFELLLTSLCLNMARKRSLVIISADLTNNIFALFPAVTNWLHLFGSDAVPTVSLQPPTAESRQNALAASFCSSWTERLLFGSASRATFRGTFFSSFFRPHQPNHLLAGSRQAVLNVCPRSWLYFYQNTFNYGIKQLDLWPRAVHPS